PDHDPGEARLLRDGQGPGDDVVDHPWVAVEHLADQRDRVVIGHDHGLLGRRQIDAHDREFGAHDRAETGQLGVAAAVTAGEPRSVGHSILLGSGWSATKTLARGMQRVVGADPTSTGSY